MRIFEKKRERTLPRCEERKAPFLTVGQTVQRGNASFVLDARRHANENLPTRLSSERALQNIF